MKDKLPVILFISTNDGSDMRINKEIRSLQKKAEVIFLGVGDGSKCYVSEYCKKVILVKGKRNSIGVITKQIAVFVRVLFRQKIKSIHIINEQLYIFFYPFLFFKHTVLDIFDSIFLKKNKGGERLKWTKWLVYLPADKLVLTDHNRYDLMPATVKAKCLVVPNYPECFNSNGKKECSDKLRILYNGTLNVARGTEIISGLLDTGLPIKIFMAGWLTDDPTRNLLSQYQEQVEFLGVLPQEKALELAQTKADYILSVYSPVNENNINASPNKIYDAIQTETPVIMNAEVKISDWVNNNGIGVILPKYEVSDFLSLYKSLTDAKNTFKFGKELKQKYIWEKVEGILFKAHQLQ